MKSKIFITIVVFLIVSCNNTDKTNSNSKFENKITATNMKENKNEQKKITDKIVAEIEEKLESMKNKSCIITVEGGYGDGMFYFYEDEKLCKISYEPGEVSEYYYFDKSGNLILAGTRQFHYQPWSLEINKFYISDLSIAFSYKCIKENDVNDPCNDTEFEDNQIISEFENNIPSRLNSFSKSLTDWPDIEKKLKELAKEK